MRNFNIWWNSNALTACCLRVKAGVHERRVPARTLRQLGASCSDHSLNRYNERNLPKPTFCESIKCRSIALWQRSNSAANEEEMIMVSHKLVINSVSNSLFWSYLISNLRSAWWLTRNVAVIQYSADLIFRIDFWKLFCTVQKKSIIFQYGAAHASGKFQS